MSANTVSTSSSAEYDVPLLDLRARHGWEILDVADIWRYRELLWILAMRDVRVRYKQTIVGAAWVVLQPITQMLIFTTLFTLLGRFPTDAKDGIPYAVSLYCALVPWKLFADSMSQSSESIVMNQGLITKVYFPRVIVPIAPIIASFVDFCVAFVVLIVLMACYQIVPTLAILSLPFFVLMVLASAFAVGLWTSAMNAIYRDTRYVFPFLIQLGFWVSPVVIESSVVYNSSKITPLLRIIYDLNPMVMVLNGFRWAMLGKPAPEMQAVITSVVGVSILLVGGLFYFRKMETYFADKV